MKRLRAITCLCLAVLLFGTTGCSWLRHRFSNDNEGSTASASDKTSTSTASAASTGTDGAADNARGAATGAAETDPIDLAAATRLANDFYEMHIRLANRGLPDATSGAYVAFLCPKLVAHIDDARARRTRFIQTHPGDKPPLVEGDLFSSLFEGAESAVAGPAAIDGARARVPVAMRNGSGTNSTRWSDDVLVASDADGILCVDDVAYRGDWAFANKGALVATLQAAF